MSRVVRSTCFTAEGEEEEEDDEAEDEEEEGSETQWKNVFGMQEWLTRAPQGKRPWTEPKPRCVVLGDPVWALRVTLTSMFWGWKRGMEVGSVDGVKERAAHCGRDQAERALLRRVLPDNTGATFEQGGLPKHALKRKENRVTNRPWACYRTNRPLFDSTSQSSETERSFHPRWDLLRTLYLRYMACSSSSETSMPISCLSSRPQLSSTRGGGLVVRVSLS